MMDKKCQNDPSNYIKFCLKNESIAFLAHFIVLKGLINPRDPVGALGNQPAWMCLKRKEYNVYILYV